MTDARRAHDRDGADRRRTPRSEQDPSRAMVLVAPLLLASVAHTIAGPPAIPTCVPALANGSCAAAVCCAVCADPSDCTTSMQAALDSTVIVCTSRSAFAVLVTLVWL